MEGNGYILVAILLFWAIVIFFGAMIAGTKFNVVGCC